MPSNPFKSTYFIYFINTLSLILHAPAPVYYCQSMMLALTIVTTKTWPGYQVPLPRVSSQQTDYILHYCHVATIQPSFYNYNYLILNQHNIIMFISDYKYELLKDFQLQIFIRKRGIYSIFYTTESYLKLKVGIEIKRTLISFLSKYHFIQKNIF